MKKEDSLNQSKKTRNFWLCAGLLALLFASILARDINRPFYGLHSWDQAAAAWRARCYLKYPLSYTKGMAVWSVGDPPNENPNRSFDHPQLGLFLPAIELLIFGINERAIRIGVIIRTLLTLLIFLKILKAFIDKKTALLAGLFFAAFPIIGYFGVRGWVIPVSLLATWYYLLASGSLDEPYKTKPYHKWILAILLFLILQLSWEGFCYALAIGVHYVFRCLHRKKWPDIPLLVILIAAPLSSLALDFIIMAAGHGWHWERIWSLYQWRGSKGEIPNLTWEMWFGRFQKHARTNFGIPVLITACAYLTLGQLLVRLKHKKTKKQTKLSEPSRRFPQFWLFTMPAIFQLLIFRGALWPHQYWELPLVPTLAIATALAVMLLIDLLSKLNRWFAYGAGLAVVAVCLVFCIKGLDHYFYIRWQPIEKINMFKKLNSQIPPDKKLLSFESFIVDQHEVKGPHYRPEVAWYLDRQIDVAKNLQQVIEKAQTGQYPYYLAPQQPPPSKKSKQLMMMMKSPNLDLYQKKRIEQEYKKSRWEDFSKWKNFIDQLRSRYNYELVDGSNTEIDDNGTVLRAGMYAYAIFDLKNPKQ